MSRDPEYYLKKADYFYGLADNLQDGNELDNDNEEFNNEEFEDEELQDGDTWSDDEYEYEYVKLAPVKANITKCQEKIKKKFPTVRAACKRYFDPITKHYYKTDKIFEDDNDFTANNFAPPIKTVSKKPAIWYPENKLSFKTMRDPITGKYYRVDKIYDNSGKYKFTYDKLNCQAVKKPGTNFYQPIYKS